MKQIFLFTLLSLCGSLFLRAQTISVNLPYHPVKTLTVTLKYGTVSDTIFHAPLDKQGKAAIAIPDRHKGYRGMAALYIGMGGMLEFIVAGEDFSIHCEEEYPHGGNTLFERSPENDSLQKWFYDQQRRRQQIGLLSELEKTYGEKDAFHPSVLQEKRRLQADQAAFERHLQASPLYAARFIEFRSLLENRVAPLVFADSSRMESMRAFVRDSLDVNDLFTSGMWFDVINGLLALYDKETPFHGEFIGDMSFLLRRAGSLRTYLTFAENLFTICETMAWNNQAEQLAHFLINDGRIREPEGRLKMLMTVYKLSKGSVAPVLSDSNLPPGKRLLVFYESGCSGCDNEIQQLKARYAELQQKGIRVVSISADHDSQVYEYHSKDFPWEDKRCDYRGFEGENFRSYGVIGTPTFFLIDENGLIQGRYARLQDVIWNEE